MGGGVIAKPGHVCSLSKLHIQSSCRKSEQAIQKCHFYSKPRLSSSIFGHTRFGTLSLTAVAIRAATRVMNCPWLFLVLCGKLPMITQLLTFAFVQGTKMATGDIKKNIIIARDGR
jgi:hypothetical protein